MVRNAASTSSLIAGAGLTGGGALNSSTDVTFNIGAGTGILVAADSVAVDPTYFAGLYQPLDADLTEIAAVSNVRGDLLLTNSGPTWTRLPIGSNGQVLTSNGTDASWVTPSAGSVSGTGTTDFLSRWADGPGAVLGDSVIGDDGSNASFWDSLHNVAATMQTTLLTTQRFFDFPDTGGILFADDGLMTTGCGLSMTATDPNTLTFVPVTGPGAFEVFNSKASSAKYNIAVSSVGLISAIATGSVSGWKFSQAGSGSATDVLEVIGSIKGTRFNQLSITNNGTGAQTLNIANGKTLTVNHTLTLTGTSGTTQTFPATSCSVARIDASQTYTDAAHQSFGTTTGTKFGTATNQKLGFWNATPVVQPSGWAASNVTTDRVFDADSTSIDEIADVLGTLISDLKSVGLLGA